MANLYGNRWEVVDDLGEGGQGRTYIVVDRTGGGDIRYVLKRLKNVNRMERFKREIESIRNLSHENIVQLVDFDLEGKKPFLVTEFCSGGNLAEANPYWANSVEKAFEIFHQVCSAISYANSFGIIHRDIKPENIFLRGPEGPAVVGDFGICHVNDGTRFTLTEERVGPAFFMAPELEDGRADKITKQSDTYSLGKLLYWLLSGGRKFNREKHRAKEWDLRKWDEFLLRWENVYMEHVNRLLDQMITIDVDSRLYPDGLIHVSQEVLRLILKEFNPIGKDLQQPCCYCGQGEYVLHASGSEGVRNFGFTAYGGSDWRIMACNKCGHVQIFRVDMASEKDWWN